MLLKLAKALLGRSLLRVNIAVTSRCNSKCSMCNVWRSKPADLDTALYHKALLEARKLGPPLAVQLTGGEPTLRGDWPDLVLDAAETASPRVVELVTNGIKPSTREVASIVSSLPRGCTLAIGVSIDGIGQVYRRARGVDAFRRALESYLSMKSIERENPDKLLVHINYTVSRANIGHMEAYLNWMMKKAATPADQITPGVEQGGSLYRRRHAADRGFYLKAAADLKIYLKLLPKSKPAPSLLRQARRALISTYAALTIDRLQKAANHSLPPLSCTAGAESIFVDEHGAVKPCPIQHIKLTSLKTSSLTLEYRHGAIREWRTKHKLCKLPCFSYCDHFTLLKNLTAAAEAAAKLAPHLWLTEH